MSDFDLYDEIVKDFQDNKVEKQNETQECLHTNRITEHSICICVDCGEELQTEISTEKEWRYYGKFDTKHISDPTRVQMRKIDQKNIYKDVETFSFSEVIIADANKLYMEVTKDKIFRGDTRKGIVFACIFHAYKMNGKPQSHDTLIKIFNLKKKTALYGLKYVSTNVSKKSDIRCSYITPEHLINEIMDIFKGNNEQKSEVIELYKKIQNRSSQLNRSRPQSVASGTVFYWITLNNKKISLKDFAIKVGLSELTISKTVKEITNILKNKENTQNDTPI